jgi:hypothetical protein
MDNNEQQVEAKLEETRGKIGKWISDLKAKVNKALSGFGKIANNEKAADGIMRWPRPVAFFMMVVMFIMGWLNPIHFLGFANALAALPADFWTVCYIILGSIGISKGANDIVKIISSRK